MFHHKRAILIGTIISLAIFWAGSWILLRLLCQFYINNNDLESLQQTVEGRQWLATAMLDNAYADGKKEAFALLLKAGANPDGIPYDNDGARVTLVHHAALNGDSFWLEKLLDHGADANYDNVLRGVDPLTEAIVANVPENVELLINCGADVNAWNYRKQSMLTQAWTMRRGEIALMLLLAGAEINPPSYKHESFIYAIQTYGEAWPALDEREERDSVFLEKARQWIRHKDLDVWNATWNDSQGDFGVWTIPSFSDHRQECSVENVLVRESV